MRLPAPLRSQRPVSASSALFGPLPVTPPSQPSFLSSPMSSLCASLRASAPPRQNAVESTLDGIAAENVKTMVLQPIGFLCDHVEILYDVDIAFRSYASNLGIRLERPESLNDSPLLAKAVADLARQGLARLDAGAS